MSPKPDCVDRRRTGIGARSGPDRLSALNLFMREFPLQLRSHRRTETSRGNLPKTSNPARVKREGIRSESPSRPRTEVQM